METEKSNSRQMAQERVDTIQAFRTELESLQHAGALQLTAEQQQSIRNYHDKLVAELAAQFDVDRNIKAKQLSLGMKVASFLGALAFAASVFFLFYQIWGRLSTTTQVVILCSASLISLAITTFIRRRDQTGYFTKLAALVAFSCFVLNIEMYGEIFNILPSDKAFVVWGAMALILAYACELRLLLVAGLLCVLAFVSARVGEWSGMYWLDFGKRPENFFPAATMIFSASLLIRPLRTEFAGTYRVVGAVTALLTLLVMSFWGESSYLNWDAKAIEHVYEVVGFIACAAAIWSGARYHWRDLTNTGVVFFVIFLFTKLYDWWWDILPKYLFFLLIGLTALLVLFVLRRLRGEDAVQPGGAV